MGSSKKYSTSSRGENSSQAIIAAATPRVLSSLSVVEQLVSPTPAVAGSRPAVAVGVVVVRAEFWGGSGWAKTGSLQISTAAVPLSS